MAQTVEERIEANIREVDAIVARASGPELRLLLAHTEADLDRRIRANRAAGLDDRWTGAQAQAAQIMIAQAVVQVGQHLKDGLEDYSAALVNRGITDAVGTLKALEAKHTGTTRVLALDDAMQLDARARGVRSSLLRQHATSVDRYGSRMIGEFQRTLQVGIVQGVDGHTMIRRLVGEHGGPKGVVSLAARILPDGTVQRLREADVGGAGLFRANAYWAERIVRTELLYAYNSGTQAALEHEVDTDFPDLQRIILAHFDSRTAEDSVFVHGQVRGIREPFTDGAGRVYMHPPARPNDRERVIPWRMAWGGPTGTLGPKSEERRREAAEEAAGKNAGQVDKALEDQVRREALEREQAKAARALHEQRAAEARQRLEEIRDRPPAPPKVPRPRKVKTPTPPPPPALPVVPPTPEELEAAKRLGELQAAILADQKLLAKIKPSSVDKLARAIDKEGANGRDLKVQASQVLGDEYDPKTGQRIRVSVSTATMEAERATGDEFYRRAVLDKYASTTETVLTRELLTERADAYAGSVRYYARELLGGGYGQPGLPAGQEPVFIRIGGKLIAAEPDGPALIAALERTKLQTAKVRIIDFDNDPRLAKAKAAIQVHQDKIDAAAKADRDFRAKMATRDQDDADRIAAGRKAFRARDAQGPPEVVAIRAKHDPEAHANALRTTYLEAADSVGWGRAMRERGLDLPIEHLERVLAKLPDGHPVKAELEAALEIHGPRGSGFRTFRELLADPRQLRLDPSLPDQIHGRAALLGHLDAIDAKGGLPATFGTSTKASRAHVQAELDHLGHLVDKSVNTAVVEVDTQKGRASCNSYSFERTLGKLPINLKVEPDESTETIWHEFGHGIDASDRVRGVRASAFLDVRTRGEKSEKLKDLTGNRDYDDKERARPDQFANPYTGKDYGRAPTDRVTGPSGSSQGAPYYPAKTRTDGPETERVHDGQEVTSMGVQELVYPANTRLITRDPDHFLFALGQLGSW